jgi:hypothetical protein
MHTVHAESSSFLILIVVKYLSPLEKAGVNLGRKVQILGCIKLAGVEETERAEV